MIGKYKWNENKQELKPVDKGNGIHSITIGYAAHRIFINYRGKKKMDNSAYGVYMVKELADGGKAIVFTYTFKLYAFRVPEGRTKITELRVIPN